MNHETDIRQLLVERSTARQARLAALWEMTPSKRVEAMRCGKLTLDQLAAWTDRRPEQVPLLDGEYEWLAAYAGERTQG